MQLQLHYTNYITPQLQLHYTTTTTTAALQHHIAAHYIQQLWVRWPTRWPLQPLQPLQKTQLQHAPTFRYYWYMDTRFHIDSSCPIDFQFFSSSLLFICKFFAINIEKGLESENPRNGSTKKPQESSSSSSSSTSSSSSSSSEAKAANKSDRPFIWPCTAELASSWLGPWYLGGLLR